MIIVRPLLNFLTRFFAPIDVAAFSLLVTLALPAVFAAMIFWAMAYLAL